jgi:hypothetical protein
MSSPNYRDFLVRQERYQDLLREANQQRMIKAAGTRPGRNWGVAGWIGAQAMRLRSTLRGYAAAVSPRFAWTGSSDTDSRL